MHLLHFINIFINHSKEYRIELTLSPARLNLNLGFPIYQYEFYDTSYFGSSFQCTILMNVVNHKETAFYLP
jgi:hypothetical protein